MSERYKIPREAWFVPFGPVRDVDLVKITALKKHRTITGAKYSHGVQLLKIERMFESADRATSQIQEIHENSTYYLRGRPDSDQAEHPGTLFIVRDGAIIGIKAVHRQDWEVMP